MLRCRRLAQELGKAIGLDEAHMATLAEAAAAHEIGKAAFTETEWRVVKMYPEVAIVSPSSPDRVKRLPRLFSLTTNAGMAAATPVV